ncbi:MAG: MFS transporter, partial [candidate division Zixibacteria bacterium]|nr:MFS transporter [candidate division Zixibacteria bacterium]
MNETQTYKRKSLIITGLGAFLATLDSSIVNVSLPTISNELSTTMNMSGWVMISYSIVIVSLLMVFSALAEKKGFAFLYSNGFVIFLIGSLLCGISTSINFLISSRVIQGIGAAMLMACGPALITKSFPASERGRGLSIITMIVSVGLMTGPPLGGFIIGLFGWRWIFLINIPVCLFGLFFTLKYLRGFPIINPDRKISIQASIALIATFISIMITFLIFTRDSAYSEFKYIFLSCSILLIGLFIYFERNPKTQLIGFDIYKNR